MVGAGVLALVAALLLEVNGLEVDVAPAGLRDAGPRGRGRVGGGEAAARQQLRPLPDAVFVPRHEADAVLRRQRRHNSGHLEELMHKDNLERECREETCSLEEAREVFEDEEKTMEFWAGYFDGNQCEPPPCQNGGTCQDGVNGYVCWCKPGFSGKNCEIELSRQCSVNNGGCSHFCDMRQKKPVCACAAGYELGPDNRSCDPAGPFSCGAVELASSSSTRTILTPRSAKTAANGSSSSDDDVLTDLYDYVDLTEPDPANASASAGSARNVRSLTSNRSEANETSAGDTQPPHSAFFPTVPTVAEKDNVDQRIVGGDEAAPGEIPWQVALVSHSRDYGKMMPFCGGSLLSEWWVITAAHCLVRENEIIQDYYVRVGEHDINQDEGPERDYRVERFHIHRSYDYNKSPYNHDIALLKLDQPVELSDRRRPICLGPKSFTESILRESSSSLVSGWGALRFQGRKATALQKLEVPYVDRTVCKQSSRDHITRFMFCAGYDNAPKDSCQGDSGGPHATRYRGTWFLTGIVSWGEECAREGRYGVYTRISQYYHWISNTTNIHVSR